MIFRLIYGGFNMKFETNSLMHIELSRLNMELLQSSYVYIDKDWNSRVSDKSSFTRIYLVTSGGGRIVCSGEETALLPGNIYIIPANTDFYHYCDNKMEKLYFHVRLLRFDRGDLFSSVKKCIILENRHKQIDNLVSLYRESSVGKALTLKSEIFEILSEALDKSDAPPEAIKKYSALVKRVIHYVERNPSYSLSAGELAQKFFISSSRLQKVFREEVGVSLGKYIHRQVISATELKLRNTEESIAEISSGFGFCDQFYFSRVFSQYYGVSPREYRKNLVSKK